MGRNRGQHVVPRVDLVHRPGRGAADVHVLDEANFGAPLARKLQQRDQLVVIHAAHHHRVDLEAGERIDRGVDAGQHPREFIEAGELHEAFALEGVEADGKAM